MKKCPKCGFENEDGKKWCQRCMKLLQDIPAAESACTAEEDLPQRSRLTGSMGRKIYKKQGEMNLAGDAGDNCVSSFTHLDPDGGGYAPRHTKPIGEPDGRRFNEAEERSEGPSGNEKNGSYKKICKYCGEIPADNDQRYCANCGKQLDYAEFRRPDTDNLKTELFPKTEKQWLWKLAGAAAAAFVLVIGAVIFGVFASGSNTSDFPALPGQSTEDQLLGDLRASETCFLVNQKEKVRFEVPAQGSVSDTVFLCEAGNGYVAAMNDNGTDGDKVSGDHIYTCTIELLHSDPGEVAYYAKTAETKQSSELFLYFFAQPTKEEMETQIGMVQQDIEAIERGYVSGSGFVPDGSVEMIINEVNDYAEELHKRGEVVYYEASDSSVLLKLNTGLAYAYIPPRAAVDGGSGDANITVITMQPCLNTYTSNIIIPLLSYPDEAASYADDNLPNISFSGNYDDGRVTLEQIKRFSSDQLVIWHGHGGYSSSVHSYLVTGEAFDKEAWWWDPVYFMDCVQNRIVKCSNGMAAISAGYIDKYCGDLSNSMFYLGACQSGKDSVLADAFINKGATAVVANSETIYTEYNLKVQNATIRNMATVDPDTGMYMTLRDALNKAKDVFGDDDEKYGNKKIIATPLIFGGREADQYRLSDEVYSQTENADISLYIPVVEQFVESLVGASKKDFGMVYDNDVIDFYSWGILYDMDEDGVQELILSYPYSLGSGWMWNYAYSIYDIEYGRLVEVAKDVVVEATAVVGGTSGYVGVALYKGKPVLIACSETGDTSPSYDEKYMNRQSVVTAYAYKSLKEVKSVEVQTTYQGITYFVDGKEVTEAEYQKEMDAFTYLKFDFADGWIRHVNSVNKMRIMELLEYLYGSSEGEI